MAGGADAGDGVPFQIEYLFRPGGRGQPQGLWIEDTGRWFAGPRWAAGAGSRHDAPHRRTPPAVSS